MIATLTLNPTIDGAAQAEVVKPMHKIRTFDEHYYPGGGGLNVARVINELGGQSYALYLAGGATGGVLQELVKQASVRISHAIYERSTNLEFRFVPQGPEVSESDCAVVLRALQTLDCKYLVASGSLPRGLRSDIYAVVGAICQRRGIKLVLDSSGDALRHGIGGGVHLAKPSLGELETLVGRRLATAAEQETAAQAIVRDHGLDMLALTLGRDGAMLVTPESTVMHAAPKINAQSAVGAGDSFLAAMTVRLAAGDAPEAAFLYGMAAGAATALTPGTSLCKRSDVERLYAELRARSEG